MKNMKYQIIKNQWPFVCSVAQWCLILCDPMDWSLPGSSVHGIFEARVLEWGAIAYSMQWVEGGEK